MAPVAAFVMAYMTDPTLTLHGDELEQLEPIVRLGPLTVDARLFSRPEPEEPDPLEVPCKTHTLAAKQKYTFDPAGALLSRKPSPDKQVEGSALPARTGFV
jgi:hypothetical protein